MPLRWPAGIAFALLFAAAGPGARAQTNAPPPQAATPATAAPGSHPPTAQGPAPSAQITAHVTEIDVPVLVFDKQGNTISGLEADDFDLHDDAIRQKITNFDSEARPLSLAIVVDVSDPDAIAQVHRSADTISAMVVGAAGEAAIFIPASEPRQVLAFTSDSDKLVSTLRALAVTGNIPSITECLNLALLQVEKQPRDHTRAVLIISHNTPRSGEAAQTLVEATMTDAIPIFHLVPNRPKDLNTENPVSTENGGTGVGSQNSGPMQPPMARGEPQPVPGSTANVNLGAGMAAAAGKIGDIFRGHSMDYVYDSGGVAYNAQNDGEFDQKLNIIGNDLRSIYHLYYEPNDLATEPPLHNITVTAVERTDVKSLDYRRHYVGYRPQQP